MAEPVPAGSDASAGTYQRTQCSYELGVRSTKHLPACPGCGNGMWNTLTGGDSIKIPTRTDNHRRTSLVGREETLRLAVCVPKTSSGLRSVGVLVDDAADLS